jgi:hypothetical protein
VPEQSQEPEYLSGPPHSCCRSGCVSRSAFATASAATKATCEKTSSQKEE